MKDKNGHDWKGNEVVCAFEICTDGSTQWEGLPFCDGKCWAPIDDEE